MAVGPTIMKPVPRRILPAIVAAQLAGTSLWFAGNAIMPDLQRRAGLGIEAIGDMTTAVQLGFIAGTLVFSFFALVDRFSPRHDLPGIGAARCCLQCSDLFRGRAPLAAAAAAVRDGLLPRRHLSGGNEDRVRLVRSRPRTGAGLSRRRAGARHRDTAPSRSRSAVGGRHALRVGDRGTGWARDVLVGS